MQRLLLLLVVLMIAGCIEPVDPNAKIREFKPKQGMTVAQVKKALGRPDMSVGNHHYTADGAWISKSDSRYLTPGRYRALGYGTFATHSTDGKSIPRFRLKLYFYNGELEKWIRTTPPSGDGQ